MFSLLNYNELKLENFQPKSGKIDENLNREGFGIQKLPGGVTIEGLWKKDKLNGEAKISFDNCTTKISGLFQNNMIQKGIIEYESGAIAAGKFQNNEIYDFFKDVKFTFACGYIFLGIYNQDCNLIQGSLSSQNGKILLNWNGETQIYMIENSNQGIIIESSRLYEGQILKGKRYGQGAEYYPLGLIYNIYTSNNQEGLSQEIDCCFLNKTQYRSVSNFQHQKFLNKFKVYPNGIIEQFDIKISQRTRISFEKLQLEGYLETFDIDESSKRPTKAIFNYQNMILDVLFQHKELKLTIFYKKTEFSIEQWYGFIDPAFKKVLRTNQKYKNKDKNNKNIMNAQCDPQKPTNCAQVREIYQKQQKILKDLQKVNKIQQTKIISLQNLNTILINQSNKKDEEIKLLQKQLQILDKKQTQNFDQQFFRGNLINGKKEGWVEEQLDKEYFQGFYKNNIRQGKGYLLTEDYQYKGNFENNKFSGKGEKKYFKNLKILKGNFMDGNFVENRIDFENYYYEGQVVNDSMNGIGKIVFSKDVYFEGVFLNDDILENQQQNILHFENKQYKGSFKFIDDLKMKVFQSKEGQIFVFNKKKGYVKKFLPEHQLILNQSQFFCLFITKHWNIFYTKMIYCFFFSHLRRIFFQQGMKIFILLIYFLFNIFSQYRTIFRYFNIISSNRYFQTIFISLSLKK